MTRILNWLTVLLFVVSIILQNPLLFLLAVLLALVALTTALWGRYALAGVTYARRFGAARLFVGVLERGLGRRLVVGLGTHRAPC